MGAAAAAANLLWELRTPEKREETLTNNKKGNVILASSITRSYLILSWKKPGAIKKI